MSLLFDPKSNIWFAGNNMQYCRKLLRKFQWAIGTIESAEIGRKGLITPMSHITFGTATNCKGIPDRLGPLIGVKCMGVVVISKTLV